MLDLNFSSFIFTIPDFLKRNLNFLRIIKRSHFFWHRLVWRKKNPGRTDMLYHATHIYIQGKLFVMPIFRYWLSCAIQSVSDLFLFTRIDQKKITFLGTQWDRCYLIIVSRSILSIFLFKNGAFCRRHQILWTSFYSIYYYYETGGFFPLRRAIRATFRNFKSKEQKNLDSSTAGMLKQAPYLFPHQNGKRSWIKPSYYFAMGLTIS